MKKCLLFVSLFLFVLSAYAQDKQLPVNEVIEKVDATKYTKAEIKDYHATIKGKKAEGTGKVVNVLPGKRDRHRVTILTRASNPEKGYNVVLYTTMNAPSELKIGDEIKFKGEIGRLSTIRGSSIDIIGSYEKIK
jgi:hypothetical protein